MPLSVDEIAGLHEKLEELEAKIAECSPVSSGLESWLDKKALAKHFNKSLRWMDYKIAEGVPHALIDGSRRFKASEVERWLEERERLRRLDSGGKLSQSNPDANGAAPRTRPAPGHEE